MFTCFADGESKSFAESNPDIPTWLSKMACSALLWSLAPLAEISCSVEKQVKNDIITI
jgi:hypothetical protein